MDHEIETVGGRAKKGTALWRAVSEVLHPDPDILEVLSQLQDLRASDLHVTADAIPRIRVDGKLSFMPGAEVWSAAKVATLLDSLLTAEQSDTFAQDLELDFSFTLDEGARFRVNLYRQKGVVGAAFRVTPRKILTLEQLGLPASIGDFAALPRGLVLVTGPTGSGKTSTLAALLEQVNERRPGHIMTVEDPIEYVHDGKQSLINQREVGSDTHSFEDALRHVLRQDPDVILIGELRDLETMSAALTAAETGHLVFATLHTQDAPQTIDRIIDIYPSDQQRQIRSQLATTLKGIVSQILLPHATGVGRVVASEILIVTPAIANLIREAKTYQIPSAMMAGGSAGMHSMDQDLAGLVGRGTITLRAAYERAHDKQALMRFLGRDESYVPSGDENEVTNAASVRTPEGRK